MTRAVIDLMFLNEESNKRALVLCAVGTKMNFSYFQYTYTTGCVRIKYQAIQNFSMHDELCKKNHLSYLDTIESGAEEDIFPKIVRIIYCHTFIVI